MPFSNHAAVSKPTTQLCATVPIDPPVLTDAYIRLAHAHPAAEDARRESRLLDCGQSLPLVLTTRQRRLSSACGLTVSCMMAGSPAASLRTGQTMCMRFAPSTA